MSAKGAPHRCAYSSRPAREPSWKKEPLRPAPILVNMFASYACAARQPLRSSPAAGATREARGLMHELTAIGNNLNQLARVANTVKAVPQLYELRLTTGMLKTPSPASSSYDSALQGRQRRHRAPLRYILGEGRHPETGGPQEDPARTRSAASFGSGGVNFGFEIESREDAELARRIMEFDA